MSQEDKGLVYFDVIWKSFSMSHQTKQNISSS